MRLSWFTVGCLIAILATPLSRSANIYVPNDFPTIQAAINAANYGDAVFLNAGRYNESLTINKSITLTGSSTNDCVLFCTNASPMIAITGPCTVGFANLEINGGQYFEGYYNGATSQGIVATNANLTLVNVTMNQFYNYYITFNTGSLYATNLALFTRLIYDQCDVGLDLTSCTGSIDNLTQDAGQIDHTINIMPSSGTSLTIDHCRIRASHLTWGNCIRAYANSTVTVRNCLFYRAAGGDAVAFSETDHNGIGINGYSNIVTVIANTFSNLPWAVYCYGSPGIAGNRLLLQNNLIVNSLFGGLFVDAVSYPGIDLGGGRWGSQGNNSFSQTAPALTNYAADVFMNTNGVVGYSTANLFAVNNTWSNPTNKESVLYDKLDNPGLGRVITEPLAIRSVSRDATSKAVLMWNERGAGEQYTVQFTTNLVSGTWTNAAGTWPITNPSPTNSLCWTNSLATPSTSYYRLRSQVP